MNNKVKIIIAVIVVIVALTAGVLAFRNNNSKNSDSQNVVNDISYENIEMNVNNVIENEIDEENIALENQVSNISKNESVVQNNAPVTESHIDIVPQGTAYSENSDVGTTNKKEEAIELVKQKWGEDSTVAFSCDSVTKEGEYIIAVTSLETATVKNYFRVNLETKEVNIEF